MPCNRTSQIAGLLGALVDRLDDITTDGATPHVTEWSLPDTAAEPDADDWSDAGSREQGVAMTHAHRARRPTQVTIGSHIRPGDVVLKDGGYVEVVRIRRAQGRKPARGENLHLVGNDDIIKMNSLDGIRIRARRSRGAHGDR